MGVLTCARRGEAPLEGEPHLDAREGEASDDTARSGSWTGKFFSTAGAGRRRRLRRRSSPRRATSSAVGHRRGRRRRPRRGTRGRGPAGLGRRRVPRARRDPAQGGRSVERAQPRRSTAGSSGRPARSRPGASSRCGSPPARVTRRPAWPRCPTASCCRTRDPTSACPGACRSAWSGVISPFNFPLILSIRAVAPALALGNAVSSSPTRARPCRGGVSLARIFEEAGLPEGLFTCCRAAPTSARRWSPTRASQMVSFTGSTRPGAGRRARCGGGAPQAGAPGARRQHGADRARRRRLEKAASVGAWGSFLHQGQVCMTTGRHLVHAGSPTSTSPRWPSTPTTCRSATRPRGQVALGPIIDAKQRDKRPRPGHGSVDAGARLAAGGTYEGLFYRPTVLADVPTDSPGVRGGDLRPGRAGDRVRLDRRGRRSWPRDTEYGLSLGILTRNVMRGLAIADRIPTGIVHINDQTVERRGGQPVRRRQGSGTGARLGGRRRTSTRSPRRSG